MADNYVHTSLVSDFDALQRELEGTPEFQGIAAFDERTIRSLEKQFAEFPKSFEQILRSRNKISEILRDGTEIPYDEYMSSISEFEKAVDRQLDSLSDPKLRNELRQRSIDVDSYRAALEQQKIELDNLRVGIGEKQTNLSKNLAELGIGPELGIVGAPQRLQKHMAAAELGKETEFQAAMRFFDPIYRQMIQMADKEIDIEQGFIRMRKVIGDETKASGKFVHELLDSSITEYSQFEKQFHNWGVTLAQFPKESKEKAMEWIQGLAETMGSSFDLIRKRSGESVAEMTNIMRSLGVEDSFRNFSAVVIGSGKDMHDVMMDVSEALSDFGGATDTTSKLVGADVIRMTADFAHFGGMTTREMASAAARIREMGVDLNAATQMASQFDVFETAADTVSKLTQAFGVQLDTFELMNEEDPTKRMEMLKDAMHAAGWETENMSRQRQALLKQTLGLEERDMQLLFAKNNEMRRAADLEGLIKDETRADADTLMDAIAKLGSDNQIIKASDRLGNTLDDLGKKLEEYILLTTDLGTMLASGGKTFNEGAKDLSALTAQLAEGKGFFSPDKWGDFLSDIIEKVPEFLKMTETAAGPTGHRAIDFIGNRQRESNEIETLTTTTTPMGSPRTITTQPTMNQAGNLSANVTVPGMINPSNTTVVIQVDGAELARAAIRSGMIPSIETT